MAICYFGIYLPDFSRNQIYISGLKACGVKVIECQDRSVGLLKFWRLFKKHWAIGESYEAMIVGYPGQIVVPLAKIISRGPVILDALCSLYEAEIISRQSVKWLSPKRAQIWLIDFLAYWLADLVLVESQAQKDFMIDRFYIKSNKVKVVYTGADDQSFYPDLAVEKRKKFTAVFRGRFLPEAGVPVIVAAAKILEADDVDILIIGSGLGDAEVAKALERWQPTNVVLERRHLSFGEMRQMMLECHVSLGQFAAHERLKRTIPHKAFESLAMGLPYLTARSVGVAEILTPDKDCLMVKPDNPVALAEGLRQLKNDHELLVIIGKNGLDLYRQKFRPTVLAEQIKAWL